jgi:hypothetical protein
MGGEQPRGLSEVIAEGMEEMLDIVGMLDMSAMVEVASMSDMDPVEAGGPDGEGEPPIVIDCADIPESVAGLRLCIPDIVKEEDASPIPNPVPAWRTYWGRHCTLPSPFARRLSTQ